MVVHSISYMLEQANISYIYIYIKIFHTGTSFQRTFVLTSKTWVFLFFFFFFEWLYAYMGSVKFSSFLQKECYVSQLFHHGNRSYTEGGKERNLVWCWLILGQIQVLCWWKAEPPPQGFFVYSPSYLLGKSWICHWWNSVIQIRFYLQRLLTFCNQNDRGNAPLNLCEK